MERLFSIYGDIQTFCDEIMDGTLEGLCNCVGVHVLQWLEDKVEECYMTPPSRTQSQIYKLVSPGPGYGHYKRPNEERGFLVGVPYVLLTQPIGIETMYIWTGKKRCGQRLQSCSLELKLLDVSKL
jgi:hypothetical protein